MKRSPMSRRKAPISPRTGGTEPRNPPRGTRIPSKRSKPRRTAGRDHGDMGNTWAIVWVRQGGKCLLCPAQMTDAHHRQTRRFGPDCPGNIIGVCHRCHLETIHGNPAKSLAMGWIVSRHVAGPCDWPVTVGSSTMRLLCTGQIESATS